MSTKGLYKKASIDELKGQADGLNEALNIVYDIYNKTKKSNLVYPVIDLAFHTMEKLAYILLFKKKGIYLHHHPEICKEFETQFKDDAQFKEMIEIYREIMNKKDALFYQFDATIDNDVLKNYINCIEQFKKRVDFYARE